MKVNNSGTRRAALKAIGSVSATGLLAGIAGANSGDGSPTTTSEKTAERRAERAFEKSIQQWHRKHLENERENSGSGGASTQSHFDPRADVYIGRDTTLDPDYGDKYESDDADSAQDAALSASYDTVDDWDRARAYDYAGYGSFRAWSYVAREFVVNGDTAQTATITIRPDVCGDMTITGEGGNLGQLELIVKDFDDNERYDDYVFNFQDYVDQWCNSYVNSMNVNLEPGHGYTAIGKLTVGTTFTGDVGGALSDFNKLDGDEEAVIGPIDIKF